VRVYLKNRQNFINFETKLKFIIGWVKCQRKLNKIEFLIFNFILVYNLLAIKYWRDDEINSWDTTYVYASWAIIH